METVLLVVILLLIGAGVAVVMYHIMRAAVSDELDERGYKPRGDRK